MKVLIMIAGMMIGAVVPAMAADYEQSMQHEIKAKAFVACAFFGDMSVLAKKPDSFDIPSSDVDTFRPAALKEWRIMMKLNDVSVTGDEEIIEYAEFVAANEAELWDKEGMNSSKINDLSRKYYNEINCPLILQTLK